ncbi:MAG: glucuronate isomerase [Clostridia bacterium]|nr:glucuronate isomerase [Clostridia bacterium]
MKPFMNEDFLLTTDAAKKLYHEYAENMPICDYHCHLIPREIAENKQFRNITELFLGGDHYKWRAMASNGVDDKFIRGDGDDYEKFLAYAKTISLAIGNPLYHWTHLELKRVFGIDTPLTEKTAPEIWEKANKMLATEEFRAKRLIEKFNVTHLCTTDDPADSLEYHIEIAKDENFKTKVLPTFRPDKAIKISMPGFKEYIEKLASVSGVKIETAEDVVKALRVRAEFFHANGCRVSDHGLDTVPGGDACACKANEAFKAVMAGEKACECAMESYRSYLLVELGGIYKSLGWGQQYHMNAQRNNNGPMYRKYGPDTGFDSISDELIAEKLGKILNAQEEKGMLPKTILYTLNPNANYVLGSTIGNFQTEAGIPGKMQFGSAWWFCDQKDGMFQQMKDLAALGMLSAFVGMLTDSRSFVSYPRHEYFRRILCELLGSWVDNGEYPEDWDTLKTIVQGICYNNAMNYFGF